MQISNLFGSGNIEVKHVQLLHLFEITTIINLIGEKAPNEELLKEYQKYKFNLEMELTAGFESRNIYGVQFHPERSGLNGLKLLRRFAVC